MRTSFVLAILLSSVATARAAGPSAQPANTTARAPQAATIDISTASPEDVAKAIAAIDPAKKADIQRLIVAAGLKEAMTRTLDLMQTNIRQALISALPPGSYRDQLADLFIQNFRAKLNLQQMIDIATVTYDKYLSDEDIRGLTQFYQTPLGHKTLTVLPDMAATMQAAGMHLGQKIGKESMQEVLAEHPEIEKAMEDAATHAPQR